MIHLIYGLPGTGKTAMLHGKIAQDVKNGKPVLLIVPEQQTVETERVMARALPTSAQLSFEVVNFSRLANKVFRVFGGLSYHYITPGLKNLLMWKALRLLTPYLKTYGENVGNDLSLPKVMLSAVGEIKAYDIPDAMLDKAAESLGKDHPLSAKLSDLSLIRATYEALVKESFDDGDDDLAKLADILEENDFFEGTNVYIDSFTDFTAQEYRILRSIFASADNVTVTLATESPDCDMGFLGSINETSKRLRILAGGHPEITVLDEFHRYTTPALADIASRLWHFEDNEPSASDGKGVKLLHTANPYEEAEAVCAEIRALVDAGYRYREIAVIARDAGEYRGILDPELEKAGISFYLSEKADLTSKPPIAMILSALSVYLYRFRPADIMTYIKTGLAGITPHDADVFETYITTWNIRGSQFTAGAFSMNPDGYKTRLSARGKAILDTANAVREKLCDELLPFFSDLGKAKTVHDLCEALYAFLRRAKIDETLKEYSHRAFLAGDKREATETANLFRAIFRVLSEMNDVLGEDEMSVEDFSHALRLVFDNTDLGTIPTAADEVMIGSASMLRVSGIRAAILIGLCEGEFPARTVEHGLFSDADRATLEGLGIPLSGDTGKKAADELFYVYRAMTTPREKLILMYHDRKIGGGTCKPSIAFRRVASLFPSVPEISYRSLPLSCRIYDRHSAFKAIADKRHDADLGVLRELLALDPTFSPVLEKISSVSGGKDCHVDSDLMRSLLGETLTLTQSQIDKYVGCPFSYFCNYILNLREDCDSSFSSADIGVFIHSILEEFMRVTSSERLDPEKDIDTIRRIIREKIEACGDAMFPPELRGENRIAHLLVRLLRLSTLVAINLCTEKKNSKFNPCLFEVGFGNDANCLVSSPVVDIGENLKVVFSGKIDRVDSFRDGNTVYLRVVDYKTGSKTFSLSDLGEGYNLQLFLYLFALCESKKPQFLKAIGGNESSVVKPAGAVYLSTKIGHIPVSPDDDDATVQAAATDKLTRSGLLLDDEKILRAMNENKDPKFLSAAGSRSEKHEDRFLSEEDWKELNRTISDTVRRVAGNIYCGNAEALPNPHTKNDDPCKYCKLKFVCRHSNSADGNETEESEEP